MNMSGGDPDEIQVNVRVEPISTFKADNGGWVDFITGEAIDNINIEIMYISHRAITQ